MFRRRRPTPIDTRTEATAFVCSSCGRSDLPETGGWAPPICLECDAAINFDADFEQLAMHELDADANENDDAATDDEDAKDDEDGLF